VLVVLQTSYVSNDSSHIGWNGEIYSDRVVFSIYLDEIRLELGFACGVSVTLVTISRTLAHTNFVVMQWFRVK